MLLLCFSTVENFLFTWVSHWCWFLVFFLQSFCWPKHLRIPAKNINRARTVLHNGAQGVLNYNDFLTLLFSNWRTISFLLTNGFKIFFLFISYCANVHRLLVSLVDKSKHFKNIILSNFFKKYMETSNYTKNKS